MKKMYQMLCTVTLISLLTGCGITGSYNLNPTLPHAKIVIVDDHDGNANYLFLSENNDTCMPNTKIAKYAGPIIINANKPISFIVYHQLEGYDTQHLGGTFVPKANHMYLVDVTDDVHGGYEIPSVQLYDQLTKEGKPYYQPVSFIPRETKLNFFLSTFYCVSPTNSR